MTEPIGLRVQQGADEHPHPTFKNKLWVTQLDPLLILDDVLEVGRPRLNDEISGTGRIAYDFANVIFVECLELYHEVPTLAPIR